MKIAVAPVKNSKVIKTVGGVVIVIVMFLHCRLFCGVIF